MKVRSPNNWGITYKILVVTVLVSSAVWFVIDHYQTQKLEHLFLNQVYDELKQGAVGDRVRFDQSAQAIFRSAKLIVGQQRFINFINNMPIIEHAQTVEMAHYAQPPAWMPYTSIMRAFYRARYALLFDEKGFLRNSYHHQAEHDSAEKLPEELFNPSLILKKLSHNQAYMTMVEDKPFLISSDKVHVKRGEFTLILITPIDSDFLKESVSLQNHSTIIALIDKNTNKIVASSDNKKIATGSISSDLTEQYLMVSKSFFDYGASDIALQLSSFTSTLDAKALAENILRENNIQRATLVAVMIITFTLIMLFFVRRIIGLARGVNKLSFELFNKNTESKNRGDEITILDNQITSFTKEIQVSRSQLQKEVDSANKLTQDLKKLHHEKSVSEQQMQEIMDHSPAAISVWDLKGNFTFINQKAAELYDNKCNDLINKNLLEVLPAEITNKMRERNQLVIETGELLRYEEELYHGDKLRHYLSIKFPLFNKNGDIYAVGNVSTDITERTDAEQEIIKAKEEADRANQAKSEFLSSMSHELRTPLNAILGFGQLIELDHSLPNTVNKNIKEILVAGYHLLKLINEILDLAKIESGHVDLKFESIKYDELILECLSLIKPIANQNDIQIVELSGYEDSVIRADKIRIKQVIINLLSNAVKYNREGGQVSISIKLMNDKFYRISIKDTGIGITEENLSRLFESFNRLDNDRTNIEGTGIGLVITKHLVERMGGKVGVESEYGVGSTFWIEIPKDDVTENKVSILNKDNETS